MKFSEISAELSERLIEFIHVAASEIGGGYVYEFSQVEVRAELVTGPVGERVVNTGLITVHGIVHRPARRERTSLLVRRAVAAFARSYQRLNSGLHFAGILRRNVSVHLGCQWAFSIRGVDSLLRRSTDHETRLSDGTQMHQVLERTSDAFDSMLCHMLTLEGTALVVRELDECTHGQLLTRQHTSVEIRTARSTCYHTHQKRSG